MEQYMYSYLNQRYGLKSLIIEWTAAIVNGIKSYSSKDCDILLFWKILRNECDEDYRFIHSEAKLTILDILRDCIKRKYKEKNEAGIEKLLKHIQMQNIEEWQWKEVLNKMYSKEYAYSLEEHIREKMQNRCAKTLDKNKKGLTREEISAMKSNKNYSISFSEFQKVFLNLSRSYCHINYRHTKSCLKNFWHCLREQIQMKMEY